MTYSTDYSRSFTNDIAKLLNQGLTPDQIMYGSAGQNYLLNQTEGHFGSANDGSGSGDMSTTWIPDNPNAPKIPQSPNQQLFGNIDGYAGPVAPTGNDPASITNWLKQLDQSGREGLNNETDIQYDPTYGLVTDPSNKMTQTEGFSSQFSKYAPSAIEAYIGYVTGGALGPALGGAIGDAAGTASGAGTAAGAAGNLIANAGVQGAMNGSVSPGTLATGALGVAGVDVPTGTGSLINTLAQNSNTASPQSPNAVTTGNPQQTGILSQLNNGTNESSIISQLTGNSKTGYASGGVPRETSGYIQGPGGPKDDMVPIQTPNGANINVSNTEYVMNSEQVQRAGGPQAIEAKYGPSGDSMRGYADGGLISRLGSVQRPQMGIMRRMANGGRVDFDTGGTVPTNPLSSITQGISGALGLAGVGSMPVSPSQMLTTGQQSASMANPWGQFQPAYANALNAFEANPGQAVESNPAFQFLQSQGTQAVNRGEAASGQLDSGNRAYDLSKFNQGLSSTFMNNEFNQLSSLAQVGASSPVASGQLNNQAAINANAAQTNQNTQTGLNIAGVGSGINTLLNGVFGNGSSGGLSGLLSSLFGGSGPSQSEINGLNSSTVSGTGLGLDSGGGYGGVPAFGYAHGGAVRNSTISRLLR